MVAAADLLSQPAPTAPWSSRLVAVAGHTVLIWPGMPTGIPGLQPTRVFTGQGIRPAEQADQAEAVEDVPRNIVEKAPVAVDLMGMVQDVAIPVEARHLFLVVPAVTGMDQAVPAVLAAAVAVNGPAGPAVVAAADIPAAAAAPTMVLAAAEAPITAAQTKPIREVTSRATVR